MDCANTITNIEFIVDLKILFHGWLICSCLQIFKLIKCKCLPGECADWFFDSIMTWSYCLLRRIQHVPAEKQHFDKWAYAEPWTCPFKFNKIYDSENLSRNTLNLVYIIAFESSEPFFLFKFSSYTHYSSTDNSTTVYQYLYLTT